MNNNRKYEIAQFVILDVGIPNPATISEAVLSSVGNTVCMSRGNHIPAVGLTLINACCQPVVRLSSTYTSHKVQKILHAINSVKDIGKCRARISIEEFKDCIYLGIKSAIEDFEALPNQLTEEEVCPGKLQITIFSMKNLSGILNHIQMTLSCLKVDYLFKILVVELVEDFLDPGCLKRNKNFSTFLEYIQVAGTARRLDELMKQWLLCGDVQQHLKLVVQDLVIWCDARDCLIRASSPPFEPSQGSVEMADDEEVLEVIHRLPTEGVCETHMFGDPVLLMPCCWQNHLKSEECDTFTLNSKIFSDLCRKLGMNDEYLITKYEKKNQPIRFFLLMPGAGFLLAKELVSAEIALPVTDSSENMTNYITPEVDLKVSNTLVSLPSISSYDPGDFSSGLYKLLRHRIQCPPPITQKEESLCRDSSHESLVVGVEMKKKIKLKKRNFNGKKFRRHIVFELPQLTEDDQQTLAECISRHKKKLK